MQVSFRTITIVLFFLLAKNSFAQPGCNEFFDALFRCNFEAAEKKSAIIGSQYSEEQQLLMQAVLNLHKSDNLTAGRENYQTKSLYYARQVIRQLKDKTRSDKEVFYYIAAFGIVINADMQQGRYRAVVSNLYQLKQPLEYVLEKDKANDQFRFIAGLYNFYAELAAEDYPIMRFVFLFLPEGNKKYGLKLLTICSSSHDVLISAYALYYLGRIFHRDEKVYYKSAFYYRKLLDSYPENKYWRTEFDKMNTYFRNK